MADARWEAYEELSTLLRRINSLMRGASAIAEFAGNKAAEITLVVFAGEMAEEAQELAKQLWLSGKGEEA